VGRCEDEEARESEVAVVIRFGDAAESCTDLRG